jgi:hypothetical protein
MKVSPGFLENSLHENFILISAIFSIGIATVEVKLISCNFSPFGLARLLLMSWFCRAKLVSWSCELLISS